MKILWSNTALNDIQQIKAFIARDSSVYATRMTEKLVAAVDKAAVFPDIGRAVPEAPGADVRELIVRPYCLIYKVEAGVVKVLTIVHSGRDLANPALQKWGPDDA